MSKEPKDEKALLDEYARALAVVGEAPPSMRSNRLRDIGLTTIGFLDLSREASAAMDRAMGDPDSEAVAGFAATFEAERAKLRAKEAGETTDAETTDPGPPPDFSEPAPALPNAKPGLQPLGPVPFAPAVGAASAEERGRVAPPPMLNRDLGRTLALDPAAAARARAAIAPVPAAPAAPPVPVPLGRGTLRMVVNPTGSVQARVLSAAVAPISAPIAAPVSAPVAARGGDTVYDPNQLPMLPAVAPPTPDGPWRPTPVSPSAVIPPMSAPRSAAAPSASVASRGAPAAASAPRAPRLTLMEYAALRADVLVSSEESRAEVYALFGFTEADDAAESAAWNARFTADRELFQRYMQLFSYLRALRGGKK